MSDRSAIKEQNHEEFELSGGALCLDLANTVGDRPDFARERLHAYGDLLRWSLQAGVLSANRFEVLSHEAAQHPRLGQGVFERAIGLREAIYRMFSALAHGDRPAGSDLDRLNDELGQALPNQRIVARAGDFEWGWDRPAGAYDQMLWPVSRSAAELLTSDEINAVRECASETCSWLFLDRSRNRKRKWCDMAVCGNRAKARRHYERHKQGRTRA